MLCIGHSHVNAVEAAAKERGWALLRLREQDRQGGRLSETLPGEFDERAAGGGPVAAFIGGNVHTKLAMLRWPRPYDFVWPESEAPLDEGAEVVPLDAIRSSLTFRSRTYNGLLASLAERAKGPVIQVEAPPPLREDDFYLEHLQRVAGMPAEDMARGMCPAPLRYKIWRVHAEMVRDICAQHGLGYLERPAEAVDDDGYLKIEFAFNPTHGNSLYGELVAKQLEDAR
jgi:hypothetical protein